MSDRILTGTLEHMVGALDAADQMTGLSPQWFARALRELIALRAELARLQTVTGERRMCVNCGQTRPASEGRGPLPACIGPDGLSACTWDLTPQEAWEFWRQKWHDQRVEVARLTRERDEARLSVLEQVAVVSYIRRTGCGDHSCEFRKPTGMGTNGGCRCWSLVDDTFRALLAAQPEPGTWQPIETAPRDGTHVLGWCRTWGRDVHEVYYWSSLQKWNTTMQPTHWMSLPDPPQEPRS